MRQDDTLGLASGARRIGDGPRIAFVDLWQAVRGPRACKQRLILGTDLDDPHPVDLLHIGDRARFGKHDPRAAIGDGRGDLMRGQARVDCRDCRPSVGDARDNLHEFKAVAGDDCDGIALSHTQFRNSCIPQRFSPRRQFCKGQCHVTK